MFSEIVPVAWLMSCVEVFAVPRNTFALGCLCADPGFKLYVRGLAP